MPTYTKKTGEETPEEFLESFTGEISTVDKRDDHNIPTPRSWTQFLQDHYIKQQYDQNMARILDLTTRVSEPLAIITMIEKLKSLALLTIATGSLHKANLLHNIKTFLEEDEITTYALSGLEQMTNLYKLNPERIFKIKKESVPKIEVFINWTEQSSLLSLAGNSNAKINAPISNSILLPPFITAAIVDIQNLNTQQLFDTVLEVITQENENNKEAWKRDNPRDPSKTTTTDELISTSDEDTTQKQKSSFTNDIFYQTATILQTLYSWSTMKNPRAIGTDHTNSVAAGAWHLDLTHKILMNASNTNQQQTDENQNKEPTQETETTNPPNPLNFTGGMPSTSSTKANNKNRKNPNDINTNQNDPRLPNSDPPLTTNPFNPAATGQDKNKPNQTGTNAPTTQQPKANTQQTTTQQPNANTQNIANQMNFTDNLAKMAQALESFTNSQAAHLKQKEEGTTKISKTIKEFMYNAMTTDFENPETDLTDTAKEIMGATGETPLIIIKKLLKSQQVMATPTPKAARGASKGLWYYEGGQPDNCCFINFPSTLNGSGLEHMDMARLQQEEANGRTLKKKKRENLNKNVILPVRSIHFLLDKATAWYTMLLHMFGASAMVTREAEDWMYWIQKNTIKLRSLQNSRDKDLPARIEIFISDTFSNFFETATFEVPGEDTLLSLEIRNGIIRGTVKPDIPKRIMDILHPQPTNKNKHKRDSDPDTQDPDSKPQKKTQLQTVLHKNQPQDLKCNRDFYLKVIVPAVRNKDIKNPMFNSTCQDCNKYVHNGMCNPDCERSASHSPIVLNSDRHKIAKAFRSEALKNYKKTKGPGDPDFQ